jgi:ribulose-phosphate 3-epimerase
MDGHFVTNISFGPPIVEATRRHTDAYLDAHLMVSRPEDYAKPIAEAGADLVTFHAELPDNVRRTLGGITDAVAESGAAVGVALNPLTPAETIFPLLDDERLKLVLVMSVVPGYSGQSFMPEVLSKCEAIKNRLRFDQRLEIDGGIGPETIASARSAGVDWFVAASAIFGEEDRATAIADLRGRL